MSRLSLKPGGEPGLWQVECADFGDLPAYRSLTVADVSDGDLMDIRSTINEYLASRYEVVEPEKPKRNWSKVILGPLWWALLGAAACVGGFIVGWNRVPDIRPSTGGVIDQLCMRPEIECSTSIRYLHPQVSDKYKMELYSTPDHIFKETVTYPEAE